MTLRFASVICKAAGRGKKFAAPSFAPESIVVAGSFRVWPAWSAFGSRFFAKLAASDLFATASELIAQAKKLRDEEAIPLLIEAGAMLEKACCDETAPDGRACVRLGRWHIMGIGDREVDLTRAWQFLLKGYQLTSDPEAAYWLGWIAANGHNVRETVAKPLAEGGCGKPGGCGCASKDLCVILCCFHSMLC
jgi:TPR repeat protein